MKRIIVSVMLAASVFAIAVQMIDINGAKFKKLDLVGPPPPGFQNNTLAMVNWFYDPGGVSFSPSDISSLQLWFDATDLNGNGDGNSGYSDGSSVSTWDDKSSNDWDAVAGTAPVLKTSIQNGKSCVRFTSASSQYLVVADQTNLSCGSGCTIFYAAKAPATLSTSSRLISKEDSITTGLEWGLSFPGYNSGFNDIDFLVFGISTSITSYHARQDTDVLTGDGFYIGYASYNGGTSGPTDLSLGLSGTLATDDLTDNTGTGLPPDDATAPVRLGARWAVPNQLFNGHICEIFYFNANLSDANKNSMNTYLNAKWAGY